MLAVRKRIDCLARPVWAAVKLLVDKDQLKIHASLVPDDCAHVATLLWIYVDKSYPLDL